MSATETPDKDVPVPTRRQRNPTRQAVSPQRDWARMKPGDSYFIELPPDGDNIKHQRRVSAAATTWARQQKSGFRFKTAQVEEEARDGRLLKGVRIWRITVTDAMAKVGGAT